LARPERNEDVVYAELATTQGEPRNELLEEMARLLRRHAFAVTWNILGTHEPGIVNASVHQALAHMEQFRGDSKFSTWFETIVRNFCKAALRERITRRNREVEFSEVEDTAIVLHPDARILVGEIKSQLSPAELRLLEGKMEGESGAVLAEELGVNEAALKMRWLRLKKKVRGVLMAGF